MAVVKKEFLPQPSPEDTEGSNLSDPDVSVELRQPLLVEHVLLPKSPWRDNGKERVQEAEMPLEHIATEMKAASSIDELCGIIRRVGIIEGSKTYSADEVIATIHAAQEYLDHNLYEIVTGVINQGNENFRELLGKRVNAITNGGALGIREKVRDLMKDQMKNAFEGQRHKMVAGAVADARSFDQLNSVISQFKRVNADGKNEFITAKETMNRIEQARHNLAVLSQDRRWLQQPFQQLEIELESLVAFTPVDSGINHKVKELLLVTLKESRLQNESEKALEGTLRRWGRNLTSFFRR